MRLRSFLSAFLAARASASDAGAGAATRDPLPPKDVHFSFEGPFGTYDRGALQRGFQVYKEVCSACHSLNHVAFHNLDEPGGPRLHRGPGQGDRRRLQDSGRSRTTRARLSTTRAIRLTRAGTLADHFPPPFPNEEAARAPTMAARCRPISP